MEVNNVPVLNKIVVAVDTLILAMGAKGLEVILIRIKNGPYENKWALPGGVVQIDESLDEAAARIVAQRVSNDKVHLEQIYCFGEPNRDVRGRSVSVAYFALLRGKSEINPKLNELFSDIKWFPIDELPEMAYDHGEMLGVAKEKLKYKLDEVEVIRTLLPDKFTLAELQRVHEVLSAKKLDKRNFVKKVKSMETLIQTGEMKTGGAFRPAKLFRFK